MCNLKEDPEDRGKFYCVNCLWKKQTNKTDKTDVQSTPTPRKTKKEQRDRQSRSKEQRGRRDGKRSSKSGKAINYQLDSTVPALQKGDPNYCSEEESDMTDYDGMDASYTRYEEDEGEEEYSELNQESEWPTITRRVSFNDDIGKALSTFIPCEPPPAGQTDAGIGEAQEEKQDYSSVVRTGGSTPTKKKATESPEVDDMDSMDVA
jgi:hypothetical protein